ncbi:MAG TPA: hypothetical protein VFD13_04165 [Candidatus Kapabacteria bacterium]|nr:hypothetical protein [Candidatus Kapabacteria bacterium]
MKEKISLAAIIEANAQDGFRYECPLCGNKFGALVGDDSKLREMGEIGSHTLCVKCQADLVVNDDGALRSATAEEMVALFDEDPDAYMLLQDMKAAIRGDRDARNRMVSLLKP